MKSDLVCLWVCHVEMQVEHGWNEALMFDLICICLTVFAVVFVSLYRNFWQKI